MIFSRTAGLVIFSLTCWLSAGATPIATRQVKSQARSSDDDTTGNFALTAVRQGQCVCV